MGMAETYGIGAIALALVGLVYKIWHDSSEQNKMLIETIQKNTEAQTKMAANIDENTRVTIKQGDTIQRHTEATLQLLTKLINLPKNGSKA